MGNKIITEKDFWICSEGAMPAQLQGTRKSTKKQSGDVYITVEDKATSSWIDFGCKKYMLLMALIAAVLVVGAIVLGVITVATGGLGLIAIGALAGLAGGVIGAVVGGLLCGHKVASKRVWDSSKSNFISQGTKTITGNCSMTCAAGGIVKFAPNIKSWGGAIAFAGTSYALSLVECAVAGAAIGAGGQAIGPMLVANGGSGVALTFGAANIIPNFMFTITGLRGAMAAGRAAGAADKVLHNYGTDSGHYGEAFAEGALPEYAVTKSIYTNGLNWSNASSAALMIAFLLVGVKAKTPTVAPPPEVEPPVANDTKTPEGKVEPEPVKEPEVEPVKAPETEPAVPPEEGGSKKVGEVYEDPVYRQDNTPYSNQGKQPGRLKSSIDENGNLVPANKDGKATVQDHVRGSEPRKSDSPYTSFSEGKPGIGKKYGDNVIEVDIKRLEADIKSGKVKDVEVLRPEKVQAELQSKVDAAQQKYNNNPSEANLKKLEAAKQDLEHAVRDSEVLIKGEIPSEYIKVYPQ